MSRVGTLCTWRRCPREGPGPDDEFFKKAKSNRRGGVVRQLDERIKKVRAGAHEKRIDPSHHIYKTAPLAVMDVDDFERLMNFAGSGFSTLDILAQKAEETWRQCRLDQLLWHLDESAMGGSLPEVEGMFDDLNKRVLAKLYGSRAAQLSTDEMQDLVRLGYDLRWLEEGVLSLEIFGEQRAAFDSPDADRGTEHYRAGALKAFLDVHATLSDEQVAAVLKLGEIDPDKRRSSWLAVASATCSHEGVS